MGKRGVSKQLSRTALALADGLFGSAVDMTLYFIAYMGTVGLPQSTSGQIWRAEREAERFLREVNYDVIKNAINTARSADEIRQAYEYGRRSHPVTIDFTSALETDLITGVSDLSFALSSNVKYQNSNLYVGDKVIVKENVGGTEYISQGTVATKSGNNVTVSSWDSGGTFPTGGFTANATLFKWQREYFDVTGSLGAQRDAITRLTMRVTDGSQGANVWLDDIRSASYINRTTCDTLNTTTGECTYSIPGASVTSSYNRYAQIRAIMSTWDTAVSPIFTSSQIEYGL